jgi:LDH2 family malate/lactate/ureidoglycolate dehydrogenase
MKHVFAFPGARDARLGTNPFCAALPRGAAAAGDAVGAAEPPLLLDMATTTIASGKARVAYGACKDAVEAPKFRNFRCSIFF